MRGQDQPLWFTQVSEAVAYLKGAERVGDTEGPSTSATWVRAGDLGTRPAAHNWIDADTAVFVIESRAGRRQGSPEAIPFATKAPRTPSSPRTAAARSPFGHPRVLRPPGRSGGRDGGRDMPVMN